VPKDSSSSTGRVDSGGVSKKQSVAVPAERIEGSIYVLRGHRVMLDQDLAELYAVSTSALVQAVRRNRVRFPDDFMFNLTQQEFMDLRSQNVISRWGGRRYPPYAFTEQGVAMLSSVLKSERAALVNIEIMRAFVRLRSILASHKQMALRLDELEKRYDEQFRVVFVAIRELMSDAEAVPPRRRIGFARDAGDE